MDTSSRPTNIEIATGTARIPLRSLSLNEVWLILQKVISEVHPCIKYVRDLKTLGRYLEEIGTFENLQFCGASSIVSRALCLDPSMLIRTRSRALFLTEHGDVLLYDAKLVVPEGTQKIHQKSVTFHVVTDESIRLAAEDILPWSRLDKEILCEAIFELDNLFRETIESRERHLASMRDRWRLLRTVVNNIDNAHV